MYLFFVYLLLTTLTNKQCRRRRKAILLSLWSPLNSVINLQEAPRTNFNTATQEYIHTRQLAKREKQRSGEGIIAVARVLLLSSCFVMPYHHNNITAFYIHISINVYRGMYMLYMCHVSHPIYSSSSPVLKAVLCFLVFENYIAYLFYSLMK